MNAGLRETGSSRVLGRRASGALGWSLANTAASRLGTLGIGIVLARILGPTEFGTFAVATVWLLAVLAFNELGVSLAIVRWSTDPRRIAPTVTSLSCLASVVLFAASWFAAPSFATVMGDPSATPVIRLMSVCIVINGLVASPAALMQRAFMQRTRMVVDQVNVWLGALVSIALALAGTGASSLAIGRVCGATVSAVLFILWSPERLRFGFDRALVRPLLRFGLPLAGASAVVFAAGYADQFVAGAKLGPTQLGFYVLAFNLASWPVVMFSQPLRSVAPAAFARIQDDPRRMATTFRSLTGVVAAVALPMCFLLAGASETVVSFVYGAPWAPAAPVLTWLAVFAAFRIMFELAYDYLVVDRRTGKILLIQACWLVALVPVLPVGASISGIVGIAQAQVVVAAAVTAPLYLLYLHRSGIPTASTVRRLLLPSVCACAAGLVAVTLTRIIDAQAVACCLAGAVTVVVVAVLLHRDRSTLLELRSLESNTEGAGT